MIRHRLRTDLPAGFSITEASWYMSLKSGFDRSMYSKLRASILFAMGIVAFLFLYGQATGTAANPYNYFLALVYLAGLYAWLVITKDLARLGDAVLFTAAAGFVLCSFLPGSMHTSLVIFVTFPILAFQMRGTRRGTRWTAAFIAVCAATFAVTLTYNPYDNPMYSIAQMLMAAIAFAITLLLSHSGERQHEALLESATRHLMFDEITGLPRRDVMMNSIHGELPCLLAILKVNNFNDLGAVFGYELSDTVLQFVAGTLKTGERKLGFRAYRLRGTEFGILKDTGDALPAHDTAAIELALREIVEYLNRHPLPYESSEIRLSYRIGGTLVDSQNRHAALSQADMALKEAEKLHIPAAFFQARTNMRDKAFQSVIKYSTLMDNREKQTYRAVFQPVFDIESGIVVWYEGLLRILNRNGEYESPYHYLPIALATGEDRDISRFMVAQACYALEITATDISVNISLGDMLKREFLEHVGACLAAIPERRGALIFEILESEELTDIDACARFIDSVKELGCKIAIDDFGSGYSNFTNIARLPIDIVKIDGALIQRMLTDRQAYDIVDGIVALCRKLGTLVVAEHIDRHELLHMVKTIGIDYGQGFLLGEPMLLPVVCPEALS
ncbi:MAG: GGDEF domain-containing protein [Spirochaetes bacterium]|nr:MAG: GGDEF domain-containing protein [Spirochaetota bacterium]